MPPGHPRSVPARRRARCPSRRLALVLSLVLGAVPVMVRAHGPFHEEAARLEAALQAHPDDAARWRELAALHLQHGDWEQALLDVERVDRLAPGRFDTGWLRARALVLGNKREIALPLFDDFLAAHPSHAGARTDRARLLRQLGRVAESLSDYRAAFAATREPEPDLWIELAQAWVDAGKPGEAVALLESGLARLGPIPALVLRLAELDLAAGRVDSALARFEVPLRSAPRPEPWMAERARWLARAGRAADARAAWAELRTRLLALPERERASHAMSVLLDEANATLAGKGRRDPENPEGGVAAGS